MTETQESKVDRSLLVKRGRLEAVGWTIVAAASVALMGSAVVFWRQQPVTSALIVVGVAALAAVIIVLFVRLRATTTAAEAARIKYDQTIEQMIEIQRREGQRYRRYLHDIIAQSVAMLGYSLDNAIADVPEDTELGADLRSLRKETTELMFAVRALLFAVYPGVLDHLGLRDAIQSLVDRLPIQVAVNIPAGRFPIPVEFNAYLIVSGVLSNVVKHAEATRTTVDIGTTAGRMSILITDNGKGGANPNGEGLMGLRLYAEQLHGTFEIDSPAGGGTTVKAMLPCE